MQVLRKAGLPDSQCGQLAAYGLQLQTAFERMAATKEYRLATMSSAWHLKGHFCNILQSKLLQDCSCFSIADCLKAPCCVAFAGNCYVRSTCKQLFCCSDLSVCICWCRTPQGIRAMSRFYIVLVIPLFFGPYYAELRQGAHGYAYALFLAIMVRLMFRAAFVIVLWILASCRWTHSMLPAACPLARISGGSAGHISPGNAC